MEERSASLARKEALFVTFVMIHYPVASFSLTRNHTFTCRCYCSIFSQVECDQELNTNVPVLLLLLLLDFHSRVKSDQKHNANRPYFCLIFK